MTTPFAEFMKKREIDRCDQRISPTVLYDNDQTFRKLIPVPKVSRLLKKQHITSTTIVIQNQETNMNK